MVGPPVPCCRIKLDDIPEMDYFAKDGKGEVSAMHSIADLFVKEILYFILGTEI